VRSRVLISLLIVAATFVVYAQVRDHEFVNYDDYVYLAAIDTGITADAVKRTFTRHIVSNWIPVTWMMLLVDYELYGREPAGYHLTNVAIHAVNAVVLFWLLQLLTGAVGRSAFVAAVFALHPLHVESVAWLSERKDVLSGLFFMLTLLAYAAYQKRYCSNQAGSRNPRLNPRLSPRLNPRPKRSWQQVSLYACVPIGLALGLMAKPMLVTLPFVLLLLDYWPLSRIGRPEGVIPVDWGELGAAARAKLPLFVLAAAASAIAIFTQDLAGSLSDTTLLTVPRRAANALDSYWIYVGKSLWPSGLAAFYPHPVATSGVARPIALGLGLVAITATTAAIGARRPYALVGWLWYVGMLVPVIGLIQVGSQARADRYTYLPQIGLAIVFAWGMHDLLSPRRWGHAVLRYSGAAVLVALAATSWLQVAHWKDTIALHSHAANVTQDNFRAHNGLAAALRRDGRLEESALHYQRATSLAPGSARTHIGLAEVLAELGRPDEAIDAYRVGLRIAPRHIRAHINLGHALLRNEQIDESLVHFERALELDGGGGLAASGGVPFLISLHRGFGLALAARGRSGEIASNAFNDRAIEQFETLLELRPNDASAHIALAEVLIRSGRTEEARSHLARGRELGIQTPHQRPHRKHQTPHEP
jgi:tetratricopeptide (TPR) repeat protein